MLEKARATGVLDQETLVQTPGYDMLAAKGKKAATVIIECAEKIPCNPCETICPFGAIKVGENITNLPTVYPDKCTGCGQCVAICPGLAIFIINTNYVLGRSTVTFAYEYLPVPKKGDTINATDRVGNVVCSATIVKVVSPKSYDQTKVITISIPEEYASIVRGIERVREV